MDNIGDDGDDGGAGDGSGGGGSGGGSGDGSGDGGGAGGAGGVVLPTRRPRHAARSWPAAIPVTSSVDNEDTRWTRTSSDRRLRRTPSKAPE